MLNNCFNQKLKAENLGFMEYWLAFENKNTRLSEHKICKEPLTEKDLRVTAHSR
jgi:hypothetical protein